MMKKPSKIVGTRNRPAFAAVTEHPGALGSFRRILALCASSRIDLTYVPRLVAISATSLLSSPLRVLEHLVHHRAIRQTPIAPSPIFIIGHWRSGTTHLQNLICQDENLGYLSAFQAIAPGFCLIGRGCIKRLLAKAAEPRNPTRPMDRVPFSLDAPQEEELALANMTSHSFSHAFVLPKQAERLFRRYVMFENLPEATRAKWIKTYLTLLHKITLASEGKRLVLKNCTNTARIPTLLQLFPNAKFIHIHRNPYDVFLSTMHLHQRLTSICQLQSIHPQRMRENVLLFYRRMMGKLLADRLLIPSGNFVEIRYQDLERRPLHELRKIYERLGLPGFARSEPSFRSYIESVSGYRKNQYSLEDDAIASVNENWRFAFDEWGYDLL